jgi:aminoglycoside phosphotransferase
VQQGILWRPGEPPPTHIPEPTEELPIGRSWAVAKHVLEACFRELSGRRDVEVGRVVNLGGGQSRNASAAFVDVPGTEWSDDYIVLVPKREADRELNIRSVKEALLLDWLGRQKLTFRVPRVFALYQAWNYCMVVRETLQGWSSEKPWESPDVVASLAAAVHNLPVQDAPVLAPHHSTRRAHAEAHFGDVYRNRPELENVHAWIRSHLPPAEPSRMVHGDLLVHNVLLDMYDKTRPPAIIDWEYAMAGDPAYDLAIVTRGIRIPFGSEDGMQRLLDAYHAAGGAPIAADEVRFYELCMHLRWYEGSLAGEPGYDSPEQALRLIQNILERCS